MRAFILILMFLTLAACGKKQPEKLEDVGRGILKINDPSYTASKGTLVLDIKANSTFEVGSSVIDAFKDIKQYFPTELDKYERVLVLANSDLSDKYGNKSIDRTLSIEWPTAELKKANFSDDGIVTFGLLNLASDIKSLNNAGNELLTGYCNDPDMYKYSQEFCNMVAVTLVK